MSMDAIYNLAPFLGVRGTIAEVVRAGGLARWQPGANKLTHKHMSNFRKNPPSHDVR
jgi:hypothetical protein